MIQIQEIRQIHRGKYLSYYELDYINLAGNLKTYEMVSKNHHLDIDSIGKESDSIILIVFNETMDKLLIPKEFRMGCNQYIYNFTAGLIDGGESYEEAARRELFEETGLQLEKIIKTFKDSFIAAPVIDELSTVIVCTASGEIKNSDSPDEDIKAEWMDKDQIKRLLADETVRMDGKFQTFCYFWAEGGINK